jgi:hypothetical protein
VDYVLDADHGMDNAENDDDPDYAADRVTDADNDDGPDLQAAPILIMIEVLNHDLDNFPDCDHGAGPYN